MSQITDILTFAVVGGVVYYVVVIDPVILNDFVDKLIPPKTGGGGSGTGPSPQTGTSSASKGAPKGGNTPGWYTLNGHHHCGVSATGDFSPDCLCTDPKKCFGMAGTGASYCAAHKEECAPVDKANWCAYWYASDQKYCNLCAGKWKYVGPNGSGAKACP